MTCFYHRMRKVLVIPNVSPEGVYSCLIADMLQRNKGISQEQCHGFCQQMKRHWYDFSLLFLGMDGCRDSDLLLLCHLSGSYDITGELQQVQIQLLQVSFIVMVTGDCCSSRESNSCQRRLRKKKMGTSVPSV